MCTMDPPAPSLELAWREIERAAIAAQMDERALNESLDAMCGAVREHLGVPSEVSTEGPPPSAHTHHAVIDRGNDRLTVSWVGSSLDDATNGRLERLFVLVGERAGAPSMQLVDVHRLRNHVAGIQANVELAKLLVDTESRAAHHDEIVKALDHALTKCRAIATGIDALKKPGSKPPTTNDR